MDAVGAVGSDPVYEVIGVESLVGDGGFDLDAVDQIMGEGDVVALTEAIRRTGGPSASVEAWILVLRSPRDRARLWASAPL